MDVSKPLDICRVPMICRISEWYLGLLDMWDFKMIRGLLFMIYIIWASLHDIYVGISQCYISSVISGWYISSGHPSMTYIIWGSLDDKYHLGILQWYVYIYHLGISPWYVLSGHLSMIHIVWATFNDIRRLGIFPCYISSGHLWRLYFIGGSLDVIFGVLLIYIISTSLDNIRGDFLIIFIIWASCWYVSSGILISCIEVSW